MASDNILLHPDAADPLPMFITPPGGTDYLFNAMAVFLIVILLLAGVFYLRLHSLPEQLAHGASKVQLQVVCVLGLLAMFTHNNLYWVAALMIALVPIPDFMRPLFSIAESLERIAGGRAPPPPPSDTPAESVVVVASIETQG